MNASLLSRRAFGRLAVASSVIGARPLRAGTLVVPDKRLSFSVLRNGSEIGHHELRFEQTGTDLVVHIDARMRVGFGPMTFFRYHHQGEERWSGGRFMSLDTQTDNNGVSLQVAARRVGGRIRIEATNQAPIYLPGDALPLTHWNEETMSARLFNPQDGTPLDEVSKRLGIDVVALANGKQVEAVRYSLNGKLPIVDWYDENQIWTALQARVKDGSMLRYVRTA